MVVAGQGEVVEGGAVWLLVAYDEDASASLGDPRPGVNDAVTRVVAKLVFEEGLDGAVGAALVVVKDVGHVFQ